MRERRRLSPLNQPEQIFTQSSSYGVQTKKGFARRCSKLCLFVFDTAGEDFVLEEVDWERFFSGWKVVEGMKELVGNNWFVSL